MSLLKIVMQIAMLASLMAVLVACDYVNGVKRTASLHIDPSPECVERVLHNIPDITTINHTQFETGHPITLSGIQTATIVHSYRYQGTNHVSGVLQFSKDDQGSIEFWQANFAMNDVPPPVEISATRPVMKQIERALAHECGLIELHDQITEWCEKVACPTLP